MVAVSLEGAHLALVDPPVHPPHRWGNSVISPGEFPVIVDKLAEVARDVGTDPIGTGDELPLREWFPCTGGGGVLGAAAGRTDSAEDEGCRHEEGDTA